MAYAAVISLQHTIARLDNLIIIQAISNSAGSILFDAYEELKFLGAILLGLNYKRSKNIDMDVINEVDARIRDAVWKLEDVYESYHHSLLPPYQRVDVDQEIDSFLKTATELREEYKRERDKPLTAEEHEAAVLPLDDGFGGNKSTTVGLSDLSQEIRTQLLRGKSKPETISILGMAGIGKTHLARQMFQHPLIVQHFDIRVWLSLGPKYEGIRNIYVDILAQIERKPRDVFKKESWDRVQDLLRNSLRGRRFLIMFDDFWGSPMLDSFLLLLPNDKNGSRVLLTTRLRRVAQSWRFYKTHQMPFLSNEESWNLLWKNVFADESNFPPQLEKAGRKIAEHCEGLPLLILAVADILRGLDKTEEYWNKVAQKKTSVFTDAYDQIYEVLLTSYNYLPEKLKPCFLYMGVFPQSREIPLSKLSYLWILEDFVEPSLYQKRETNAMTAMEDLVSNSLAIVCKRSFERVGRIKSCKLHSAYWYLCITEARKNKLFHVLNKLTDVTSIERPRRLSVQNNILFGIKGVYDSMAATTSTTRSLLFTGEDHQYPVRICSNMMLLMKVLDAIAIRFYEFPAEVVKLLQLRYLALTHNGELPSSINKLKQLEWLILRRHHNIKLLQRDSTAWLPGEIWDMKKLRYLHVMGSNLPVPCKGTQIRDLVTLYVNADSCREDVFRSLPNLQKLGIKIEFQPVSGGETETLRCLEHIGVVDGLESLKCVVVNPVRLVAAPPHHLSNLPRSLKKLSLNGLGYSWKYMSVIGSLPNLRVLKLRCSAFQGAEWETEAGQFKRLEFLLLEDIDLLHWRVKSWPYFKCFRSLRHLILRHCYKLKKIPRKIGDGGSLERMEVGDCSPSVVASAEQVKKKRTSLQVVINSSWNLR